MCHAYCMAQNQAKCQTSCESLWLCYPKTPRWDSCDEIPLPSRGLPTNLWVHHWRWMWSTSLLVLFTWCHGRQMTKLYKIPQDLSNCKRWFNLPFFGLWNYLVAIDLRTSNRGTVDKLQAFDPRIQFCRDVIRFVFFWESWDFTTGKLKYSLLKTWEHGLMEECHIRMFFYRIFCWVPCGALVNLTKHCLSKKIPPLCLCTSLKTESHAIFS